MMIVLSDRDSGKQVMVNPDYITEIDPIPLTEDGTTFSRVYMATGHRTFIDVRESPEYLRSCIASKDRELQHHIIRGIDKITASLEQIRQEIKRK